MATVAAEGKASPPGARVRQPGVWLLIILVRQPVFWLLVILGLGLLLRWVKLDDPLQQDEFGSLYAVAERAAPAPNTTPAADQPLGPVSCWAEVRARSVLPFAIPNPVPLYHWLLYPIVKVLPIEEKSLRLPSLLAGLGCVAALYFLCKRLLGAEVGLVAALLAAVDPMQVDFSTLARPFALGNLACVLSFFALFGLLRARTMAEHVLALVGYAVSMALVGYFNPALLMVGVAHAGLVAYWCFGRSRQAPLGESETANPAPWAFPAHPSASRAKLVWWLGGTALALALLAPGLGYVWDVYRFTREHREYLAKVLPAAPITALLVHNAAFLAALLAVSATGSVLRQLTARSAEEEPEAEEEETAKAPASEALAIEKKEVPPPAPEVPSVPPPENPDLVWLGRVWLFLPQIAALLVLFAAGANVLQSRFLSYTTLGGAVLLAYWATRDPSRDVRLGVAGMAALAMIGVGFVSPVFRGLGMTSSNEAQLLVHLLNGTEERPDGSKGSWRPEDAVLFRSKLPEADFLPEVSPETRPYLEGALAAPITTLYVAKSPRHYLLLSLSNRRGAKATTGGKYFDPERFYTPEFATRLRGYPQFWVAGPFWDHRDYLDCLLPWLADALGQDLLVARHRKDDRYFTVPKGVAPDQAVPGLTDSQQNDFTIDQGPFVIRVQRVPQGAGDKGAAPGR
jgi:hypothetical protein